MTRAARADAEVGTLLDAMFNRLNLIQYWFLCSSAGNDGPMDPAAMWSAVEDLVAEVMHDVNDVRSALEERVDVLGIKVTGGAK